MIDALASFHDAVQKVRRFFWHLEPRAMHDAVPNKQFPSFANGAREKTTLLNDWANSLELLPPR